MKMMTFDDDDDNNNNYNNNKTNKYISATHIFTPVAIETAGTWHHQAQAVELVQELGRRATIITGDSRETTYLFQQLSVALQKGN